jgi:hypothetical protein
MDTSREISLPALGVLTVVALLACACTGCGEPPPLDTSFLTGDPCEPPCWQGLTPGVSTEDEVEEFLGSSKLVEQSSIFRGEVTRDRGEVVGTTIQWWSTANTSNLPRQFGNHSVIKDGMLQYMTIWVDSEVTVQDLLERHGPPAKFTAWLEGVESPYVKVTLFYPRHGFEATLIIRQGEVELRPDGEIVSV